MIRNGKQSWQPGQQVNVGFLKGLTVLAAVATPGDYAPDAYVLSKAAAFYSFVPHNGLTRIDQQEAARMITEGRAAQAKLDARLAAQAAAQVDAALFRAKVLAA